MPLKNIDYLVAGVACAGIATAVGILTINPPGEEFQTPVYADITGDGVEDKVIYHSNGKVRTYDGKGIDLGIGSLEYHLIPFPNDQEKAKIEELRPKFSKFSY